MLQIFIGYDSREQRAYDVACDSLLRHASVPVQITPLRYDVMSQGGLIWRRTERLRSGSLWDCVSKTPTSTEFSYTRFLVPQLVRTGTVLFVDCDVVFTRDVAELFSLADEKYAVQVVKHAHVPVEQTKMDGQIQRAYRRKNWASAVLWHVEHPAHQRLNIQMINTWPRDLLSQFSWLLDEEIGDLPPEWNHLVNVQPMPSSLPALLHFTRGGPFLPGWEPAPHDYLWLEAEAHLRATRAESTPVVSPESSSPP